MKNRFNKNGILIMQQRRPPEEFCLIFDGLSDSGRGNARYRPATVPSRLKSTD